MPAALPPDGPARAVFHRVATSREIAGDPTVRHRNAVALARHFGMQPIDEEPQAAFSWDGTQVRTRSEPAVLIHEVRISSSPARRCRFLPDFGLGAGPETGRVADADRARRLGDAAREIEEQLASLLGVLWEIELGQPGIEAFQEQNWLEGAGRPGAAQFLVDRLDRLIRFGLVDPGGTPLYAVRIAADA